MSQGEGERVDLPMAWSELAILAQCKGKLQEDCFEILCKSLNHAPLHEENIPTLFFLAESVLYWLRTDSVNNSHLRTAEISLLKLGFLVFVRLYYHHLTNNLSQLDDFKTRLLTYLEGVKEYENLYNSYPGVWLSIRFIARIGSIITAPKISRSGIDIQVPQLLLRPVVYQALQVWRCKDKGIGLKKALLDIIICAKDLSEEDWVDSLLAISILGDAAKTNFTICRSFQDIARGVTVPIVDPETPRTTEYGASTISPKKQTAGNASEKEVKRKETRGETFQKIMNGMMADLDSALGKTPYPPTRKQETAIKDSEKNSGTDLPAEKIQTQPTDTRESARLTPASRVSHGSVGVGSNPNTARSDVSDSVTAGISSWTWEVAFQYSQIMTDICLHGANASVQKMALLGKWLGADVTTFRAGAPNFCIESCGMVDLLEYRNPKILSHAIETKIPLNLQEDWSWRVRYGALSGLLHLTHALKDDKLKEGMRSAAWSLILALQNSPASEDRVLEALRVGQVEYPYFNKPINDSAPLNIWSRISHSLTEHFLLPTFPLPKSPSSLAGPLESRQSMQRSPRMKLSPPPVPTTSPRTSPQRYVNRTTLKDHLAVPANINNISFDLQKRNELNLGRLVEDQWRKQLIREHEQEEKERIEELKNKRKEEEQRILEINESRKVKLNGKPTQNLGPYEIPNFK